jgi:hypothetical protein
MGQWLQVSQSCHLIGLQVELLKGCAGCQATAVGQLVVAQVQVCQPWKTAQTFAAKLGQPVVAEV